MSLSSRVLNLIFLVLISSSILLVILSFFLWNDPKEYQLEPTQALTNVNIEQCVLGAKRNKVEIIGWAYVERHPRGFFQVYGKLENGYYRKFETFSQRRSDVLSTFQLDNSYEFSGFKAGYRGLSSSYTGEIVVRMTSPSGEVFSATYQC